MLQSLKPRERVDVVARRDRNEGRIDERLAAAVAADALQKHDVRLASLHIFDIAGGIAVWYRSNGEYSADEFRAQAL